MPNFYTQFSFIIPLSSKQSREIVETINTAPLEIFEDPENTNLTFKIENLGLRVYASRARTINDAINLIEYCIDVFHLPPIGFTWAVTCSEPDLGGSYGGAYWTNGYRDKVIDTVQWLLTAEYET